MAAINSTIVFIGSRLNSDDSNGSSWEVEYAGTKSAILSQKAVYDAQRVKNRADLTKPVCTLTAWFPYDPTQPSTSEVPVEKWEIDNERVPVDIFSHVDVADESDRYAQFVANGDKTRYRKEIEDAVEDGELKPAWEASGYPNAERVYELMIRGTESFETHRPVLTRTRSFSLGYVGRRKLVIETRPRVYYQSELVSTFAVPQYIASILPDAPTQKIAGTEWGWKIGTDTSSVSSQKNMVEETLSFQFAAWSWFLYKFSDIP